MPARPARPTARGLFSDLDYGTMRASVGSRPLSAATPTRVLAGAARTLGLGALVAKDETARFGLNAFKLLGARFAIEHLLSGGVLQPGATLVCASEGNHGRAVARAAREAGCQACVYVAADVAQSRVDAIAGEGAVVVRVRGSYDDAVREVVRDADVHGWAVISDTAWPGYEDIPRLIMLGYTRMMDEVDRPFDAVFVQGGVGGLLCAVASWCAFHYVDHRPVVVCVEPLQAACLLASARAGHPTPVEGPLDTMLAGLRNREVSPLAFEAVRDIVDAYIAIDDRWAHDAMRRLARPFAGDPTIAAGASGAAAFGGLLAVCGDPLLAAVRERLALGATSRVLVVVSEGVTDPTLWDAVMEAS